MRAYIMTTGALFTLLSLAHLWRIILERHLATHPWFILTTIAAGAMGVWAGRLLWRSRQP